MKFLLLLAAIVGIPPAQTIDKLKPLNVKVEPVISQVRPATRLVDPAPGNVLDGSRLGVVSVTAFDNGTIEVDLTGDALPGTPETVRGFTGIAFRVSPDAAKYECFYVRPKNGRSEDQLQRNHSAQYISNPDFPWQRLRSETPSKYESYVDLMPGAWTKMKIEVRGDRARLYVNGAEQPTLIVTDLKHGQPKA